MNRKHVATSKEAFGRRNDQKNPSNMADNDAESETAKKKAPPTKKDAEMKQASNTTKKTLLIWRITMRSPKQLKKKLHQLKKTLR